MKKVGKNYYYFQAKYGYMMRHVRYMNSRNDVYYFGGDGVMVKNVFYTWSGNDESHTYYFGSNGKMQRGWIKLDGKRYYFDPETGIMYKNCTIKKTERAIHLMKMVYTQLYPQQIRKNKKCGSERKAAGIFNVHKV